MASLTAGELAIILKAQDDASGVLKSFAANLRDVDQSVQQSNRSFSMFGGGLTGAFAKFSIMSYGVKNLSQAVVGGAQALFSYNAGLEQTTVAFKGLTGSAQGAQQLMQNLRNLAASTPLELNQVTTSAQRLLGVGVQAQQIPDWLRDIGDAAMAMGGGAPEIDRITLALTQMMARGNVDGQDMMQIAQANVNAWGALSTATGKTTAQLQAMSQKGLLPASQYVPLMVQGFEKMFGGQMQAQAGTFNGMLSSISDNLHQAFGNISMPLFTEAKQLAQQFLAYTEGPAFQQLQVKLTGWVQNFANQIGPFLEHDLPGMLTSVGHGIEDAISFGQQLVDTLRAFGPALDTGKDALGFTVGLMRDLLGYANDVNDALGGHGFEALLALAGLKKFGPGLLDRVKTLTGRGATGGVAGEAGTLLGGRLGTLTVMADVVNVVGKGGALGNLPGVGGGVGRTAEGEATGAGEVIGGELGLGAILKGGPRVWAEVARGALRSGSEAIIGQMVTDAAAVVAGSLVVGGGLGISYVLAKLGVQIAGANPAATSGAVVGPQTTHPNGVNQAVEFVRNPATGVTTPHYTTPANAAAYNRASDQSQLGVANAILSGRVNAPGVNKGLLEQNVVNQIQAPTEADIKQAAAYDAQIKKLAADQKAAAEAALIAKQNRAKLYDQNTVDVIQKTTKAEMDQIKEFADLQTVIAGVTGAQRGLAAAYQVGLQIQVTYSKQQKEYQGQLSGISAEIDRIHAKQQAGIPLTAQETAELKYQADAAGRLKGAIDDDTHAIGAADIANGLLMKGQDALNKVMHNGNATWQDYVSALGVANQYTGEANQVLGHTSGTVDSLTQTFEGLSAQVQGQVVAALQAASQHVDQLNGSQIKILIQVLGEAELDRIRGIVSQGLTLPVYVNYVGGQQSAAVIQGLGNRATGGIVGPNEALTLVGERGPELAIYPYASGGIVGANGPEILKLPTGTQILTAAQTAQILGSSTPAASDLAQAIVTGAAKDLSRIPAMLQQINAEVMVEVEKLKNSIAGELDKAVLSGDDAKTIQGYKDQLAAIGRIETDWAKQTGTSVASVISTAVKTGLSDQAWKDALQNFGDILTGDYQKKLQDKITLDRQQLTAAITLGASKTVLDQIEQQLAQDSADLEQAGKIAGTAVAKGAAAALASTANWQDRLSNLPDLISGALQKKLQAQLATDQQQLTFALAAGAPPAILQGLQAAIQTDQAKIKQAGKDLATALSAGLSDPSVWQDRINELSGLIDGTLIPKLQDALKQAQDNLTFGLAIGAPQAVIDGLKQAVSAAQQQLDQAGADMGAAVKAGLITSLKLTPDQLSLVGSITSALGANGSSSLVGPMLAAVGKGAMSAAQAAGLLQGDLALQLPQIAQQELQQLAQDMLAGKDTAGDVQQLQALQRVVGALGTTLDKLSTQVSQQQYYQSLQPGDVGTVPWYSTDIHGNVVQVGTQTKVLTAGDIENLREHGLLGGSGTNGKLDDAVSQAIQQGIQAAQAAAAAGAAAATTTATTQTTPPAGGATTTSSGGTTTDQTSQTSQTGQTTTNGDLATSLQQAMQAANDAMTSFERDLTSGGDALHTLVTSLSGADTALDGFVASLGSSARTLGKIIASIPAGGEGGGATAMAEGGTLWEPVAGIGLHTGRRYLMGERGPEDVVPRRGGRRIGGGSSEQPLVVNVNVGNERLDAYLGSFLRRNISIGGS